MRPFRELKVWQDAHQLTLDVYDATRTFPAEERYALTSQLRRAAYSVPFNIVEGTARGDTECRQFLRISLGSASELEYGLLLSRDLGYLTAETYAGFESQISREKRMLNAFIANLTRTLDAERPRPRQRPTANGQRPAASDLGRSV